jgi:hypothetical protein
MRNPNRAAKRLYFWITSLEMRFWTPRPIFKTLIAAVSPLSYLICKAVFTNVIARCVYCVLKSFRNPNRAAQRAVSPLKVSPKQFYRLPFFTKPPSLAYGQDSCNAVVRGGTFRVLHSNRVRAQRLETPPSIWVVLLVGNL